MKGPWWRWKRFWQRRKTHQHTVKPWNAMVFIGGLLALDQVSKHVLATQRWAWHDQPHSWLVSSSIIALLTALLLLTSLWKGAALAVAGALGNISSEAIYDRVANPLQIAPAYGPSFIAFNLADVFLIIGYTLIIFGIVTSVVRSINTSPNMRRTVLRTLVGRS